MTAAQFIQKVEAHYGEYERAGEKQNALAWAVGVQADCQDGALDKLLKELINSYSTRWRTTPSNADFEALAAELWTTTTYNAWGESPTVQWRKAIAKPDENAIALAEHERKLRQLEHF